MAKLPARIKSKSKNNAPKRTLLMLAALVVFAAIFIVGMNSLVSDTNAKADFTPSPAIIVATDTPTPTPTPLPTPTPEPSSDISDDDGVTVWISETGTKYHGNDNCDRMNPSKAQRVSLDYARTYFEPCKNCRPPK